MTSQVHKPVGLTSTPETRLRWPDPENGPWSVFGYWMKINGQRECVGLELWKGVEPTGKPRSLPQCVELPGGPQPLASTDLRQIPIMRLVGELWERQREVGAGIDAELASGMPDTEEVRAWIEEWKDRSLFEEKPPRRRRDRELLEQVATIYQQAVRNQKPPTKAVHKLLPCSYSTATKYVKQARDAGLLESTTQGRRSPVRSTSTKKGKKR